MTRKKSIFKVFALVLSLAMMLGMSTVAFATEHDTAIASYVEAISEVSSEDYGIAPASYIDPDTFTFYTYNGGSTRTMDGRYLAYECTIINSNSPYVKIYTYVDGVCVRSDNISSYGKVDWIDMGYSGSHKV